MPEQLFYTSVDRTVSGRSTSGWQVAERTPGWDEGRASAVVGVIDPRLLPAHPLSAFPTAEEVAAADRRLSQRVAPEGTLLLHTAPAGPDTTRRPTTVTHVLLREWDADDPLPLGIDLWRSPGWLTPFGAEQVRGSRLPPASAIAPGPVVDDDAVAELVSRPGSDAVLAALADAACTHQPVVLATETVDEAAVWIGALSRLTAPASAARISWSLLERIESPHDGETLAGAGWDIVCIPRADLAHIDPRHAPVTVVDPHRPPEEQPATAWGRLAAAAASDVAAWVSALDGLREVLDELPRGEQMPFAWPLAMAQAREDGLLDAESPGSLTTVVQEVLLSSEVQSVAEDPYLSGVRSDVLATVGSRPATFWHERLAQMEVEQSGPDDTEVPGPFAEELAGHLIRALVADPRRLQDSAPLDRVSPWMRRAVSRWQRGLGESEFTAICEQAARTVETDGTPESIPGGLVLAHDCLVAHGLYIPPVLRDQMLWPAQEAVLLHALDTPGPRAEAGRLLSALPLTPETRAELLLGLDRAMQVRHHAGPAADRSPGSPALAVAHEAELAVAVSVLPATPLDPWPLPPAIADLARGADLSGCPEVHLAVALAAVAPASVSMAADPGRADAETVTVEALQTIGAAGRVVTCRPEVRQVLLQRLGPQHLELVDAEPRHDRGEAGHPSLWSWIVVNHPDDPRTARSVLGLLDSAQGSGPERSVSAERHLAAMIGIRHVPLIVGSGPDSSDRDRTVRRAELTLQGARYIRRHGKGFPPAAVEEVHARAVRTALAVALLSVAAGRPFSGDNAGRTPGEEYGETLIDDIAGAPEILMPVPFGDGLTALAAEAARGLCGLHTRTPVPAGMPDPPGADRLTRSACAANRAAKASSPFVRAKWADTTALLATVFATLPSQDLARLQAQLLTSVGADRAAQDWVQEHLLGGGRGLRSSLRRLGIT